MITFNSDIEASSSEELIQKLEQVVDLIANGYTVGEGWYIGGDRHAMDHWPWYNGRENAP